MKTTATDPYLVGRLNVGIGTLVTSCVDEFAKGHGPRPSVITYRAGNEVKSKPSGYRPEVTYGNNYYNYNGTYHRPHSGRYIVLEASRRDAYRSHHRQPCAQKDVIITELPRGYRMINRLGVRDYQVNDTDCQTQGSGYMILSRPY